MEKGDLYVRFRVQFTVCVVCAFCQVRKECTKFNWEEGKGSIWQVGHYFVSRARCSPLSKLEFGIVCDCLLLLFWVVWAVELLGSQQDIPNLFNVAYVLMVIIWHPVRYAAWPNHWFRIWCSFPQS